MCKADIQLAVFTIVGLGVTGYHLLHLPATAVIQFSGYSWTVKDSRAERVGPGPNRFSLDAVEASPDGLKLKILERNGQYHCAEVICRQSLGYGTYRFHIDSPLDQIDANIVLGIFTWSNSREEPNGEMDIEVSRWSDTSGPTLGQFVVQPHQIPGNMEVFALPPKLQSAEFLLVWRPGSVQFELRHPHGSSIRRSTFSRDIPRPGGDSIHLNFWLRGGTPPGSGTKEVFIRAFDFQPAGPESGSDDAESQWLMSAEEVKANGS